MQKKKHFYYYLNHKNLIGEIEQYGYVITVKKIVIAYFGMIIGSMLAAYLFRLTPVGYMVICGVSFLLTPVLVLYSYRSLYEQRRFSDCSKYLEKMLYYFKSSRKVLDSLENASVIFHPGAMKTAIDDAIRYIHTENVSDIEKNALMIIEKEFPNNRVRRLHNYIISVEKRGGNPDLGIEMLLLERERWTEEVVLQQKERKHLKMQFCIFSILLIGMCLVFLYIPISNPTFGFDLSKYGLVRAASVLLIVITLVLYTKLSKIIGKSWVEEDKLETDEELEKKYNDVINYNEKKEMITSFTYASILAIATGIIYIMTTSKIVLIIGACITLFVFFSYKIGYKIGKKELVEEIEKAFPEWILQIALLMQYDNVPMSIAKSYETAPGILKPEIKKMLIELDEKPTSPVPYNDFMRFFNLVDINEAMNALYSVVTASGSDIEKEFHVILSQNNKMAEKSAQMKREDKTAMNEMYIYTEVAFGCVLLLVDAAYMMLSFMSLTSNMM